jgi:hypothetical protein
MIRMNRTKMGALLGAMLWVWGAGAAFVAARPVEAAGFGGFRGGGFRSGGGFRGFGGFRSSPQAPSGGFGGFRSTPRPPDTGFGGFRGPTRSPGVQAAPPPMSAPGAPRVGTAPVPVPVPVPATPGVSGNRAPSSIGTPLPGARPGASEGQKASPSGPSSISTPMPSARPETPSSSGGVRFSTRQRPGGTTGSLDRNDNYRRGWGGVYVPPGYGYWSVAPYHWLWFVGWPSPYPVYGIGHHASLGMSLLMSLLFLALIIGVVAIVMIGVRRMSGNA